MTHADLTVAAWQGLSDEAAARTAAAIARETGSRFEQIKLHGYAGRRARTASFDRDGTRLVLVPGGTVRLGFDPAGWTPSARQLAGFEQAAAEWNLDGPIHRHIGETTSPSREVTLPALLVAAGAAAADDLVELTEDDDDQDHAWLINGLRAQGLRLPSPDEWEHACAAGATTLYRWGDDNPDGEPYGKVPLIQEPNLFGLVIAHDPYAAEFTADPAVFCGGDGGSALCGGYGDFLSWLTLATAYREPELGEAVYDGGLVGETPARPVLEIG
ncbi:hypothetical protein FB565_003366 [Actinoplanes lutulentus]|uniref:Formylglycine-generating enzyme required for sulfatase activity n=1 Tax=Actinoplanes lutulentus TaxID=1287878 RepID=A0A327Z074_9ACTN|nr:hypothetical protein [Actinoplanes lutulentus]MBB2943637.1 hypothetical protein [Actinoplanes lutulentus]RAK27502.1 hypothetical protein B0I29_123136 [Actinoplanes lutulentus]